MPEGVKLIHWGGVVSCVVGGVFYVVSLAKQTQARQLGSARQINHIEDLKHLVHLLPLLVALRGKVWTDTPLECETTTPPTPCVIAQMHEEQQVMKQQDGSWVRDNQTVRHSVRETKWSLEEGKARLPVVDALKADVLSLDLAGERFTEDDRSMTRKTLDHLAGLRVIGRRQREHILPVGTMLTAVGEVAKDMEVGGSPQGTIRAGGHALVMRPPKNGAPFILSKSSLPELVESLQLVSGTCKTIAIFFGGVGATLIASRAISGAWVLWRKRRLRQRAEEANRRRAASLSAGALPAVNGAIISSSSPAGPSSEAAADPDRAASLCVVCLERQCDMVFTCGHLCACERCSRQMDKCPICRHRSRAIKVYRT
ncbi:hypothetical protein WJX72_000210 [[Myrmecia] bisecta]|uniref:RING-type E3 ubiquitin transferase n=1 Tax=[Myrmecia] bisecta TaxID=41462 RepID=A0AAW1Q2M4_9CHLO